MQPAFVLQDLMHSQLAGSRGDSVEGELKQRAGEGPLRRDGDDAAPTRHIGRTQSRPNGSVRSSSSRPREEAEEGCGLGAPAATNLDSEHNEVAARRARKLGVGVATLPPRRLLKRKAGLTVSSWPRLAGASDRADAGGVDSKLSPVPKGQAVADDLYPACVGHWGKEVHVCKAHVAGNPSASLLADPGDGSLKREGAGGKGPRGRTGGAVVTERVKHTSAGTEPGCKRQR